MLGRLVGFMLVLGALLPSSVWISLSRDSAEMPTSDLAAGVVLFRLSLAVLGLYVLVGTRLGWWRRAPTGVPPTENGVSDAGQAPVSRAELVGVLGLTAIGAALRLYGLDEALWNDEVVALVQTVRPPLGEIITTYPSENQHFLYSVLASLSISSFGEAAWALRLPAALFGIATLWALWQFGRALVGPREALLATVLLTFSYEHIWFSQNARGYALLLFWSVVSSHLLLRAIRERDGRLWLGYAVAVTLGMYTHLTMAFMVAGQVTVYGWHLLRRGESAAAGRWTPLFSGFVLPVLMTVTMYAVAVPQILGAMSSDLSYVALWRSPVWMLSEMSRAVNAGPLLPVVITFGIAVVGAGMVSYWRRAPELVMLFVVPVVSGALATIALQHHLWPRFFFFAAGFAILFVVRGIFVWSGIIGGRLRWPLARRTLAGTAVTLLAAVVLGRSVPNVYGPKQDYAGARDFIAAGRAAGDAVATVGGSSTAFQIYYAPDWQSVATMAELDRVRDRSERTWLVYAMKTEVENSYPEIYAAAQRDFQLVDVFWGTVRGGEIYVFRADRRRDLEPIAAAGRNRQ